MTIRGAGMSTAQLLGLRVGELWAYLKAQDLAYWAMCAYLVVEFVRPQQLISIIRGAPLGQLTLGLAIVGFGLSMRDVRLNTAVSLLFGAFTLVIIVSCAGAYNTTMAFNEFTNLWLSWVVVYILIVGVVNTEQRFVGFVLVWLMCHYYMAQGGAKQFAGRGFRFAPWGIIGAPGWFANSGEFAIAMCMFTFVAWAFYEASKAQLTKWRKWFVLGMPITSVLGVMGASSRGSQIALAIGVVWTILQRRTRPRTLILSAVLAAGLWAILPDEQKGRFQSAGEDRTSTLRLAYWKAGRDMAANHPTFGIGFGNWLVYYARYYSDTTGGMVQVSHNIFIQAMSELGYIGLAVLVALLLATFATNHQTRKLARSVRGPPNLFIIKMAFGFDTAVLTFVVAGFFVTVLYYPFYWVTLAMIAALNAIARRNVERQARGGAPLPRMQGRPLPQQRMAR